MSNLFMFDVDSFLRAGKAANVANPDNPLEEQNHIAANDVLTAANVQANCEVACSTLAGISRALASPKTEPEANISNISSRQQSDSHVSFSARETSQSSDQPILAEISNPLALGERPQKPTLAGLATLATGQTAEGFLPAKLERLINQVAKHYDCAPAEIEEIREIANRDKDGALAAYRAMAVEIEVSRNYEPIHDMPSCED